MYWLNKSKCDLKNWNYYYLIFLWNQNWKKNNNLKITFYIFYSVVENKLQDKNAEIRENNCEM